MGGSIQLARLFGIRIGASPSWFAVLFVMIYLLTGRFRDILGGSDTEAYAVAVAAAALFFVSIVLHELGHALEARRNGIGISGIELWFFGGVARMTRDTDSPGEEFRVAAAGPAVTALIVVACSGAAFALSEDSAFLDAVRFDTVATTPGVALLGWLAAINLVLLVFNLVPAFPLDGGRIARALAWKVSGDKGKGTRVSARMGQGFAYGLMGLGAYLALTSDPFNGIWFMVLGFFLYQGARGAIVSTDFHERIDGVTAGDLMDTQPVWLPAETPVQEAKDAYFRRYGWPWFPVLRPDGEYLGVLVEARVDAALTEGRPRLEVGELLDADGRDELAVLSGTSLEHLLGSEPLSRHGALMVVDDATRLVGVVTVEQVRRALAAAAPGHA